MEEPQTFSGKVAIVTGGGSGIGRACATLFFKRGASVVIAGRDKKVKEAAEEIDPTGKRVLSVELDLAEEEQVKKMVEEVVNKFGRVDILVNCAGVTRSGKIDEITVEEWQMINRDNGLSTFLSCKYAIAEMKKRKYGKVVNVSSIAGRFRGRTSGLHYAYAKSGILGFTRQLAAESAPFGINVNVVAPSQTMTTMLRQYIKNDEMEMELAKHIPIGSVAKPEQQAEVILFLCSDASNYMVGATVDVNGGQF
ncbi:MAG: SDR family oxidoreductase [Candidatus Zambryskibacteria bacterium]|nr:SDR family oxidoreductase [Candidatus Zambryskibacteria bacterium]